MATLHCIIAQTGTKAVRILADTSCDPWLPLSQITIKRSSLLPADFGPVKFRDTDGRVFEAELKEIELPDWLYEKKGYAALDRRAAEARARLKEQAATWRDGERP